MINSAITHSIETKQYHSLVIAADVQVTEEEENIEAIVVAPKYPLALGQ